MGNRAVITTPQRKVGLYVHWNGGRDTIKPLLRYCELKGYRDPAKDDYGWARMCQVLGNFFGGSLCVGIDRYSTDEAMDPGDNGIYVTEGWKIVDRVGLYEGFAEQDEYDFDEMLRQFDASMPESERLGEFLDSVEVPVSELEVGDEVWMFTHCGDWRKFPVVGFGQPEHNRISVWVKTLDGKTDVTYPDQHLSGRARPWRRLLLELQQLRPRRHRAHRAAQADHTTRRGPAAARAGKELNHAHRIRRALPRLTRIHANPLQVASWQLGDTLSNAIRSILSATSCR